MFRNFTKIALSLILLFGFVGAVQAEMTREEAAIKFRRSALTTMSWYFGQMARVTKGDAPYDKAAFAKNAEYVAFLSKLPKEGFIPGTDKGETKAKPEIWTDADKFKEAYDRLVNESAKLAEVAKDGNFDSIKEQFGKVQKACKSCHEDFKKKAD